MVLTHLLHISVRAIQFSNPRRIDLRSFPCCTRQWRKIHPRDRRGNAGSARAVETAPGVASATQAGATSTCSAEIIAEVRADRSPGLPPIGSPAIHENATTPLPTGALTLSSRPAKMRRRGRRVTALRCRRATMKPYEPSSPGGRALCPAPLGSILTNADAPARQWMERRYSDPPPKPRRDETSRDHAASMTLPFSGCLV